MTHGSGNVAVRDRIRFLRLGTTLANEPNSLDEAIDHVLAEVADVLGWPGRRRDPAELLEESGFLRLPVHAEGRPVAVLEFAPEPPPLEGAEALQLVKMLVAQLSLIAGRERMREAVRRAAAVARDSEGGTGTSHSPYDEETGLPCEWLFLDRIGQSIRRRQRSPRNEFAVLVMGIDGPDAGRHPQGDEELRKEALHTIGRRLAAQCRPADTIAHLEEGFGVLLDAIRTEEEALRVAKRLRKEVRRRLDVSSRALRFDARIGVVVGKIVYDGAAALLSDARSALRRARAGEAGIELFDASAEERDQRKRWLESELGRALQNEDLFLEYQPIVSLDTGRITGLEALVRWKHDEVGLIPPAEFVAVAEETPLIFDLGCWILEVTCAQIRRWQDRLAPLEVPPVAVNVTGRQLYRDDFVARVREILERHAMQGERIRFDASEKDLMNDPEGALAMLDRLHGMGVRVAIDDFGTGFSSLRLLHELPVSALKIDRSFISRPQERLRKWGVARTIVELARILEIDVIAEGIETREQFLELKNAGCTQGQGFFFARAVNPARAEELIRDGYPLNLEAPLH